NLAAEEHADNVTAKMITKNFFNILPLIVLYKKLNYLYTINNNCK
ncbi:MAG: hypothetical protein CFH43_01218, partial [Proteobacteria bacterium]